MTKKKQGLIGRKRKKQPWKEHPKDAGGWKGKKYTPKTWTVISSKSPMFKNV